MDTKELILKQKKSKKDRSYFWGLWKLETENGRQRWLFQKPPNEEVIHGSEEDFHKNLSEAFRYDTRNGQKHSADLILRLRRTAGRSRGSAFNQSPLEYPNSLSQAAAAAAHKNIESLAHLQRAEGQWAGDYGGPLFLLPALVIASNLTESPFSDEKRALMIRYMLNHQNEDGGWGMHIESGSIMFSTVLQYCALRILGSSAGDLPMEKARRWILKYGGATNIPSWGKFFLSILGVYEWAGCNSLLPEIWLLPRWIPLHPGRYWCHARMVYLPMSYCFGHRIKQKENDLIKSLRSEIYNEDYESIKWENHRNSVSDTDVYKKTSVLSKSLFTILNLYEKVTLKRLRRKAQAFVLDYINAEDRQTKFIDIGPVNQIINSICIWHTYGRDSEAFRKHVDRWDDYLWVAEDGMKMNGYNGSQLWDTAFTIQAVSENIFTEASGPLLSKAYSYLEQTQIREEIENRRTYFRHASVGGWPFSTLDHGWPIADCTAEGLKSALKLHRKGISGSNPENSISVKRMMQSVDLILGWQNKDGGWATYENRRSGAWLEVLNPSQVFGEIMVDYSWIECTSACITALVEFQKDHPDYKQDLIREAILKGLEFIVNRQNEDGSWIGSWGICFTYGTWFGVEALVKAESYLENRQALGRACKFLISQQKEDGGWGESYKSCIDSSYTDHPESQVVNTGWALLALMAANCPSKPSIEKGIQFLVENQMEDGEWPQQSISGVFNKTCMISYSAYRNIFPLWALGRYTNSYSRQFRRNTNSN